MRQRKSASDRLLTGKYKLTDGHPGYSLGFGQVIFNAGDGGRITLPVRGLAVVELLRSEPDGSVRWR